MAEEKETEICTVVNNREVFPEPADKLSSCNQATRYQDINRVPEPTVLVFFLLFIILVLCFVFLDSQRSGGYRRAGGMLEGAVRLGWGRDRTFSLKFSRTP